MQKIFALFIGLALVASTAAAQEPPAPDSTPAGAANPYVIYYGWLTDSVRGVPNAAARRIAAAAPRIAVVQPKTAAPAGHLNISPQVLALLHGAGTSVYAYVSTRWSRTDIADALTATEEALATGADGILFDEADPLCSNVHYNYYRELSQRVRARGKRIIFNTGVTTCGPRIMELADYVMLEHQWRRTMPWMAAYPPERFMGVSSNEGRAMGYHVDERRAISDTREALQRGIGWHTSTDRYINLPHWFSSHLQAVANGGKPRSAIAERSAAVGVEELRRTIHGSSPHAITRQDHRLEGRQRVRLRHAERRRAAGVRAYQVVFEPAAPAARH